MANTLTALIPKLIAQSLPVLRNQAVMPRLVYRGYETLAQKKGNVVTVPLSAAQTVGDVSPGQYGPDAGDNVITSVPLTLNKWRSTSFGLNDQEMTHMESDKNFIPGQIQESMAALADDVNSYIFGLYLGIYGYSGTAGSTPFQTNARPITNARNQLNAQKCPMIERYAVLDNDAAEEVLNLSSFADASQTADGGKVKIEGQMGKKYGFDLYEDNAVVSHTAGTDGGAATINSATIEPVGETTIKLKGVGGTLALLEGDIITIAGDTQTYVVDADVTITSSNNGDCVIAPGLKVATSGDEAITIKATHVVNLAFNRNCFAFVSAPMTDKVLREAGANIFQIADPVTGLILRVEVVRQHKQVAFEMDILYGAALIQAERGCRIAG